MTYYTALVDAAFMGYHNISRHSTEKAARAALRRKLISTGADAGIVAKSEPKWDDAFSSRVPSYVIGIMTESTHPSRKIKYGDVRLPDRAFVYQMRKAGVSVSRWPAYLVNYDGSLRKK